MIILNRRLACTALGLLTTGGLSSTNSLARGCFFSAGNDLVKAVYTLPSGFHYTYPHSNGFLNSESCILSRGSDGSRIDLINYNLRTHSFSDVISLEKARIYYAISNKNRAILTVGEGVVIIDINKKAVERYINLPGWRTLSDCDISPDGNWALINRFDISSPLHYRIDMLNILSGQIRLIYEADHPLDHAHFSPHDPSWVIFADGSSHTNQRIWVWNARYAPKARSIFNQIKADGSSFRIGHERAMFNKLAVVVVAYASGSAQPRGLYEVSFDGTTRLVSESNMDYHCNVSRDGQWAVVSTLTEVESIDRGISLCKRAPDDWTKTDKGWTESDITAVNMVSGERRLLYRASNLSEGGKSKQPWEPQPSISPDGRWVICNDAKTRSVIAIEIDQKSLIDFLKIY